MSARSTLSDVAKGFVGTIPREIERPIAKAGIAAVREAGEIAKSKGRASIAASGFSRKWQNALRVNIYPPQGDSLCPAAFIFHKIRYAGVIVRSVSLEIFRFTPDERHRGGHRFATQRAISDITPFELIP